MAKILLVEGNEMNRDMLSRQLAKRGYEVTANGHVGVVVARSERPALVLIGRARRQAGSRCACVTTCRSKGEIGQ